MIVSDQAPPGQDFIMRRLRDLERQVKELQAGRRLEAASIGSGGLTIKDGGSLRVLHANGLDLIEVGPSAVGATPIEHLIVRRPDGSAALWIYGTDSGDGFLAVYDRAGNIIMSDDAVSGQGLATPYIPGHFASWGVGGVPADQTGSGAFTVLQKAIWRKQHPRIQFNVLVQVTATTGEIRWRIASGPHEGTIIATVTGIGTGASWATYGPYTLAGGHLTEFDIDLEGRVSAGAGVIGVRTLSAIGLQS